MAKVIIIEDEKAMSDLVAIKFKVEGFEVTQAGSLAEAKQKMDDPAALFDAMLTDFLLPDGDLFDFLGQIRQNPKWVKLPIIIMTNYIEDLNTDKLKQLGVSEALVKYQVVPAQMVEKIKALIGAGTTAPQAPPMPPAAV